MSEDYPLGGEIEPYDIIKEQEYLDHLEEELEREEHIEEFNLNESN